MRSNFLDVPPDAVGVVATFCTYASMASLAQTNKAHSEMIKQLLHSPVLLPLLLEIRGYFNPQMPMVPMASVGLLSGVANRVKRLANRDDQESHYANNSRTQFALLMRLAENPAPEAAEEFFKLFYKPNTNRFYHTDKLFLAALLHGSTRVTDCIENFVRDTLQLPRYNSSLSSSKNILNSNKILEAVTNSGEILKNILIQLAVIIEEENIANSFTSITSMMSLTTKNLFLFSSYFQDRYGRLWQNLHSNEKKVFHFIDVIISPLYGKVIEWLMRNNHVQIIEKILTFETEISSNDYCEKTSNWRKILLALPTIFNLKIDLNTLIVFIKNNFPESVINQFEGNSAYTILHQACLLRETISLNKENYRYEILRQLFENGGDPALRVRKRLNQELLNPDVLQILTEKHALQKFLALAHDAEKKKLASENPVNRIATLEKVVSQQGEQIKQQAEMIAQLVEQMKQMESLLKQQQPASSAPTLFQKE